MGRGSIQAKSHHGKGSGEEARAQGALEVRDGSGGRLVVGGIQVIQSLLRLCEGCLEATGRLQTNTTKECTMVPTLGCTMGVE